MNNKTQVSERSVFLALEQQSSLKKLFLPEVVKLPRAGDFDDKEIKTSENNWKINSGGKLHSFIFYSRKSLVYVDFLLKVYLAKFLQLYSVKYSHFLLKVLKVIIDKNLTLTPRNLITKLESLANSSLNKSAEFYAYSVCLPYAKQTANKRGRNYIKLPAETAKLFFELKARRNIDDECNQFLRKENGALNSRVDFFIKAINRQIYRFPPPSTQKLVDEGKVILPKHTPYDYRHNLGHQMAMAGASAEEIASILGHSTLVVARHYISSTPEIAFIKQRALGENEAYLEMMGMILTGKITNESRWKDKKVAGDIDNTLFIGIGGCSAPSCQFSPVRSCYSCTDFCPFNEVFTPLRVFEKDENRGSLQQRRTLIDVYSEALPALTKGEN